MSKTTRASRIQKSIASEIETSAGSCQESLDSDSEISEYSASENHSISEDSSHDGYTQLGDNILEIRSSQTAAIKKVFDRFQCLIHECRMVFTEKKDDSDVVEDYCKENDGTKKSIHVNDGKRGGLRIVSLTEDKCTLIRLKLEAHKFEHYYCGVPRLAIGVDMQFLTNMLKVIDDSNSIIIYMRRDNLNKLYIKSTDEYYCKETRTNIEKESANIEFNLLELDEIDYEIPKITFDHNISIPSDKFQQFCKKIGNNTNNVIIRATKSQIFFIAQGEGGKITLSYKDTKSNRKSNDSVYNDLYGLKNLMTFSKCEKLCQNIVMYMKEGKPLVLSIAVASIGKMHVFMTPIENPDDF